MNSRRVKIVRVSYPVLESLLKQKGNLQVTSEGIPDDAEVVRVCVQDPYFSCGTVGVMFSSAEFPEVEDGQPIPELDMYFRVKENRYPSNRTPRGGYF